MNAKKTNLLFLIIILLTYALIVLINLLYYTDGYVPSIIMNNFLSEMTGFLPAIAFILISGDRFSSVVPFKKIRLLTILLIPVVIMLVFPMVAFINSISLLFVDNTALSISGQILSEPMWKMLLSIGIFGPFVEEFIFRGLFFHGYSKSGNIFPAIILSSVCFALMHMNINQAAYAFFIGVVFALMTYATGSVLTSFIAHALFNSFEVCMMYFSEKMSAGSLQVAQDMLSSASGKKELLSTMAALICPALVCAGVALVIIYQMANLEGRAALLKRLKDPESRKEPLITIPLVAAFVLCAAYMIYTAVLTAMMR